MIEFMKIQEELSLNDAKNNRHAEVEV